MSSAVTSPMRLDQCGWTNVGGQAYLVAGHLGNGVCSVCEARALGVCTQGHKSVLTHTGHADAKIDARRPRNRDYGTPLPQSVPLLAHIGHVDNTQCTASHGCSALHACMVHMCLAGGSMRRRGNGNIRGLRLGVTYQK